MKRGKKANSRPELLINKNRYLNSKRSQLQISFGMIFSIILIIAFLAVAIYAIVVFLGIGKCINAGLFKDDLQNIVNNARNHDEYRKTEELKLPSDIKEVCFIDLSKSYDIEYDEVGRFLSKEENMFFYPLEKACEGTRSFEIKYIDIDKIIERKNPYCIKNINGKVELRIEKGLKDILVDVS